jgi:hypothetical protein
MTAPVIVPEKEEIAGWGGQIVGLSDQWLKTMSVTGIVLYGLGLIVANSYLARLGISDFSLFKPQCVFTGAWSALFLACAALPSIAYYGACKNTRNDVFVWRFLKRAFVLVGTVAAATFVASLLRLFLLISANPQDNTWGEIWWSGWSFTPPGWGTLLFLMNFVPVFFVIPIFVDKMPDHDRATFRIVCFSLLFFALIGAAWIGYQMYPAVSRVLGGGRSEKAVLVFNKDADAVISKIISDSNGYAQMTPATPANAQMIWGDLVFQNSDYLVVGIQSCNVNGKVVGFKTVIDKKLIAAYFPLNTDSAFPIDSTLVCPPRPASPSNGGSPQ